MSRKNPRLMIMPGMADVHVHLRVPGGEHKEDYRSGSAAALAGGVTSMMAMPNTNPPIISLAGWRKAQAKAKAESLCDATLFAGASLKNIADLAELGRFAPALKLYMNLTYGDLQITDTNDLNDVFRLWPADKVLALHAEGDSVMIAIALAEKHHRRIHFCHISRKGEIERIAIAKNRGLRITCEVTPHHLFLNENDARRLGPLGDMRPKLASQKDVDALWEHINTTIDCVASDHAPHTLTEKQGSGNPPPGVPGLESTLPLLLTAAAEGRLSYDRLAAIFAVNPRRIYSLPEQPDTWIEVDPLVKITFPTHTLNTKCGWSPFSGYPIKGRIEKVILRGKEVVSGDTINV